MFGLLRSNFAFDLKRLISEVAIIRSAHDFGEGTFAHSISLPAAPDIEEQYRTHRNNTPYTDILEHCPYVKQIFDKFNTPKAGLRLLRRLPYSAYSLHDDKDMGENVARTQIPVITNQQVFLVLPGDTLNRQAFNDFASSYINRTTEEAWFEFSELEDHFCGVFKYYRLQPGYMYYFDTKRLHTLVNAGSAERITLSMDFISTPWLTNWINTNMTREVETVCIDDLKTTRWKWNSLRFGIIDHT